MLVLTVLAFSILYAMLELPKTIINDAIGAKSTTVDLYEMQPICLRAVSAICRSFEGCGRTLDLVVGEGVRGLRIGANKFIDVVSSDPEIAMRVLRTVSGYLEEVASCLRELTRDRKHQIIPPLVRQSR